MDLVLCTCLTGKVWELVQYLRPFNHELKNSVAQWDPSPRTLSFFLGYRWMDKMQLSEIFTAKRCGS